MCFVFAIKTRHMSFSHNNGKIPRKEMSKLFSCDYDHYDLLKCRQNVNFESLRQEKEMDFDYGEEYLRSIPNKVLLWQY